MRPVNPDFNRINDSPGGGNRGARAVLLNTELEDFPLARAKNGDRYLVARGSTTEDMGEKFSLSDIAVQAVERDDDVIFSESSSFGDGMIAVLSDVLNPEPHLGGSESGSLAL